MIRIVTDILVLLYATLTVWVKHVMSPMVSVLWDVRWGSMGTSVTGNVLVVRQAVTNLQDDVMETVQSAVLDYPVTKRVTKVVRTVV